MKFSEFVQYLDQLESIASRNEMTEVLSKLLDSLGGDEIKEAMYLLQGRVAPEFIPLEFNFAGKQFMKSLALTGVLEEDIIKSYARTGDVGITTEEFIKSKSKGLSIKEVYDELKRIALLQGKGSTDAKIKAVTELLSKLDKVEAKFIGRILVGHLRLGLSDKTVLDALSWVIVGDKSQRPVIERAYSVRSDIGLIAEMVLTKGVESIEGVEIQVGLPLAAKLVERESTPESLFERMGEHVVQPKYDGMRAQIHYSKDGFEDFESNENSQNGFFTDSKSKVRIFSRNMESLTDMFPDVGEEIEKFDIDSIVLDSEVIGYDEKTGKFFPFQETSTRRRKHGVSERAEQIPIKVMTFDILYLNGKDLSNEKLEDRLNILREVLKKNKSEKILLSESPVVHSVEEFEEAFDKYVAEGLEGVISKKLGTVYEAGTRNFDWIKMKFTIKSHLVDSVDTVILGWYNGRGARAKFGLGALLLGIFNPETGKYESVAKLGTGITDEEFGTIKQKLDAIKVNEKPKDYLVSKFLDADVWVEPRIVVEVEADEITKSKNHMAAMDSEGRGLSLRFPRMKVFERDKDPDQSTSPAELLRMFALQRK